jgi:membrane-associated protein
MDIVQRFLHVDQQLHDLVQMYGPWIYGILFVVIFAETGFVVTPFLPGDSLLFAAGLLAHGPGGIELHWLVIVLLSAAVLGDNTNYFIGRWIGPHLFRNENSKIFKRSHLDRTHAYFEKYGGKTLIIARWLAIVRTFAPFVAGMGKMEYPKFLAYSVIGGSVWVVTLTTAGYLSANIPWIKDNMQWAILAIIFLSLPLAFLEAWKERRKAAKEKQEKPSPADDGERVAAGAPSSIDS